MSIRRLWFPSVLVSVAACGEWPGGAGGGQDARPSGLIGEALAPVKETAEVTPTTSAVKPAREPVWRRYVAAVAQAADACPAADAGWTGTRLFRSGKTAGLLLESGKKLPDALERYCVYTWGGKGAPAAPPNFGDNAKKVVRIDADKEVVVPQLHLGGDTAVRGALAGRFVQALGAVGSGVRSEVHVGTKGPARVAVIDTLDSSDAALTYEAAAPRQRHGLAMAEVIAALRCPNGESGCRGQQFFAQAFPYDTSSPQPLPSGGPLGSLGSLAYAIGEATTRWQVLAPQTSLILNLSVAWDPRYGGELTAAGLEASHTDLIVAPSATVPATVQAVHVAMVYATCLQALPIAAAGNNAGSGCAQSGLMAPASWERYPAPDAARCATLFGALPAWRPGIPRVSTPAPALVYAAGGVDAAGRSIPNARPGGTPSRVLVAIQAVAGAGPQQTDAWTGTSVAAAALSGIAAGLWSHDPAMTPHQVMAQIDASGASTGPFVDGAPTKRASTVITAHAAFGRMCTSRYPGTCPNPYAPPTMPTAMAWPAALTMAAEAAATPLACETRSEACGAGTVTRTVCGGTTTTRSLAGAPEPWVRPQPDIPICPVCPVRGGRLMLSLSPDFNTATLQEAVLEFRTADGSFVGARVGPFTIPQGGLEVDLSAYTVDLSGGPVTLAALLAAQSVQAGVLGFEYTDAAGRAGWMSSVVTVEP